MEKEVLVCVFVCVWMTVCVMCVLYRWHLSLFWLFKKTVDAGDVPSCMCGYSTCVCAYSRRTMQESHLWDDDLGK